MTAKRFLNKRLLRFIDRIFRRLLTWAVVGLIGYLMIILHHESEPFFRRLGFNTPETLDLLTTGVKEFGMATIIASILALTFESLSAREFHELAQKEREDIKRDVFNNIFGNHVPVAVRKEVIEQVFRCPFARRGMIIRYFFDRIDDEESEKHYMRVRLKMSYHLVNTTFQTQAFPFVLWLDRGPSEIEKQQQVRLLTLGVKGCKSPFSLDQEHLSQHPEYFEREDGFITFDIKKTGNSIEVLHDRPALITVEYQTVYPFASGHAEIDFQNHVCEMDLAIHLSDEIRDLLEVTATTTGAPLRATRRHDPNKGYYSWNLGKRALLPGQGIDIMWRAPRSVTQLPKDLKFYTSPGAGSNAGGVEQSEPPQTVAPTA